MINIFPLMGSLVLTTTVYFMREVIGHVGGSGVLVSLGLHGSLHLLHHPHRNRKWLQLIHPDIWTVPEHSTHRLYYGNHSHTLVQVVAVETDSLVLVTPGQILDVLLNQQVGLKTEMLEPKCLSDLGQGFPKNWLIHRTRTESQCS